MEDSATGEPIGATVPTADCRKANGDKETKSGVSQPCAPECALAVGACVGGLCSPAYLGRNGRGHTLDSRHRRPSRELTGCMEGTSGVKPESEGKEYRAEHHREKRGGNFSRVFVLCRT